MKEIPWKLENACILVVDDQSYIREWLQALLERSGFQVITAENGYRALEQCKSHPVDLVITDIMMEEMDGYTLCRELKKNYQEVFLPVIFMTGMTDIRKGIDTGADEYLIKPVRGEEVLARIHAMLRIRALHQRLMHEYHRLDEENRWLGEIQRLLLPRKIPTHPNFDCQAYYEPLGRAGGDFYDVLELDHKTWAMVVGDVVGHGSPAALVMAVALQMLRTTVGAIRRPKTVLTVLNERLRNHLPKPFLVTLFYALLDLETGEIIYAAAGHLTPLLIRSRERREEWLASEKGLPLCTTDSIEYEERKIQLTPGDLLFCYTDGIVEARNESKELFGEKRLVQAILHAAGKPLSEIIQAVCRDCEEFLSFEKREDDLTFLAIQSKETPTPIRY